MRCPKCSYTESKVIDTRPADDGFKIRRRRECMECGHRFTTYEKIEETQIVVIKRDGTRQGYNRDKIINGLIFIVFSKNFFEKTVLCIWILEYIFVSKFSICRFVILYILIFFKIIYYFILEIINSM